MDYSEFQAPTYDPGTQWVPYINTSGQDTMVMFSNNGAEYEAWRSIIAPMEISL